MAALAAPIINGFSSLAGGYAQSQALGAQGDYQSRMSAMNQKFADAQAQDAVDRGDKQALQVQKQGQQMRGSQRAALAASGVNVDDGSAAQVQQQTTDLSNKDALTIKNNAWREAWGYKVQAANYGAQSAFEGMAGRNAARNTLLTGGLNAAGYFASTGKGK